jgi:glycosyltransferase involved in cell wall biosynthesis
VRGITAPRPDVVVTLTTPPLLPLIGTLIKWLRGSKHFLWEMDLYPDVAVDVNYIRRGGLLDRAAGVLADLARHKSDGIIALGDCMRRRLLARGIPQEKILVAENWADGKLIRPVPRTTAQAELVVLYSGNLGLAHDVDTIAEAMQELKQDKRFHFVFAGGGPLRPSFEDRCWRNDLRQVEFKSYARRSGLGESLGAGDVGLVTQRASCLGSVVPSKIYGLMAAARPILFIGPAESTAAQVIQRFRCGWHVPNGHVAALVQLLARLAARPAEIEEAGRRARQAFLEHYDRPLGVARICRLLGAADVQVRGAAA